MFADTDVVCGVADSVVCGIVDGVVFDAKVVGCLCGLISKIWNGLNELQPSIFLNNALIEFMRSRTSF